MKVKKWVEINKPIEMPTGKDYAKMVRKKCNMYLKKL